MHFYQKVSCTQCGQYTQCPQKTRMLVNYCGSRRGDILPAIKEAIEDCRMRQGLLLKRDTRAIPAVVSKLYAAPC